MDQSHNRTLRLMWLLARSRGRSGRPCAMSFAVDELLDLDGALWPAVQAEMDHGAA
jgi:hypothetical protein